MPIPTDPPHAPTCDELLLAALEHLPAGTGGARAVVGFDGFIDDMARVIGQRDPDGRPVPVPTIEAFGRLVVDAAGRSFGREIAVTSTVPGGNAPNLAEGLIELGVGVDFFGTLGDPVDPVFAPFAASCGSCTTLGACGRTLALEFDDGKLMLNNTGRLAELDAARMDRLIDDGRFGAACRGASLLGFANWSRYPHMTACWRTIASRVLAPLTHRPWLMVDLADPSGHPARAIHEMLAVLTEFSRTCRVVLGVNLNESGTLLRTLGGSAPADSGPSMSAAASTLREHTGIEMTVIHSQRRAAIAWPDGAVSMNGAYTPSPVRTTGVGDRFNAGLCAALLRGADPRAALTLACAAGAWFVTRGTPLTLADLSR